jgi:hypothetical protein
MALRYNFPMSNTNGSSTRTTAEAPEETRDRVSNGICDAGVGVLALGVCLHALAAAAALAVAVGMAVLGVTGGSVVWAAGVGAVLAAGMCGWIAGCRRRAQGAGQS